MTRMHGPDQNTVLVPVGEGPLRVAPEKTGTITLTELFDIIYDRLDYVRIKASARNTPEPLSNYVDIEAVTQQAMVEVRKKLGLYREDDTTKKARKEFPNTPGPTNCNEWRIANRPGHPFPTVCERCGAGPCPFKGTQYHS